MFDVNSAIIEIQQHIIKSQSIGGMFKICIPPLLGVMTGFYINELKDSFNLMRENRNIKKSVKTEFEQELEYLKKCINATYSTIKDWSDYYESFLENNENIPKIIYAKVHSFLAFEKYKIDYYNLSDDIKKEHLKRIIVDYESLNNMASILNEHYMTCKKGDPQNRTVSGANNHNNYLHCLIEYLNSLVVFVYQIEKTLCRKQEEVSDIYIDEISEEVFCSVGIAKNDLDKAIISINRYYPIIKIIAGY